MKKQSAVRFFFKHAGFSYDPKTETRIQGRWSCARALAAAEQWARDHDAESEWRESDIDSSDFSDEKPAWPLWDCIATTFREGSCIRYQVGSLSACDFGRDRDPWSDAEARSYARVVEAEIAAAVMEE